MHVGSLHLLRVPARGRAAFAGRFRAEVARRLYLVPVFTRRIAALPFDLASPVWVEDPGVDLDWHIRRVRLPRAGTMAQLESLVARLHAELLDRERPLWRFYLVAGLESGELAWYAKIHHATLDGAAGVKLAEALLDTTPKGRRIPPPPARVPEEAPGLGELLGAAIAKSVEQYGKLLRARDKDVHDDSKQTTLPVARAIVDALVRSKVKAPWYVDLLNLNLGNHDLGEARARIARFLEAFARDGTRITQNLAFAHGDDEMTTFDQEVRETRAWFQGPRFAGITRLHTADPDHRVPHLAFQPDVCSRRARPRCGRCAAARSR